MIEQSEPTYGLLVRRKSVDIFVCMLVISVLLHVAMSSLLLLPGRLAGQARQPLYVDLATFPAEKPAETAVLPEQASAPVEPAAPPQEPLPEPLTAAQNLQQQVESTLQKGAESPETLHQSAIGIGMTSGYFGSFAEGETLRDDVRLYYFALMRRINEVWWQNNAVNPALGSGAALNLVVSRDGKVIACEVLQSSGNREHDQALLASVKRADPLPPLPASYPRPTFNAPIRFVPPLQLMLPQFTRKTALPHGVN